MNHTVWIAQLPMRYDSYLERRVPKVDVSPAKQFGGLNVVIDQPIDITTGVQRVRDRLTSAFNPKHDYLIQTGEPIIFAAALEAALSVTPDDGQVRVLYWLARARAYKVICVSPLLG